MIKTKIGEIFKTLALIEDRLGRGYACKVEVQSVDEYYRDIEITFFVPIKEDSYDEKNVYVKDGIGTLLCNLSRFEYHREFSVNHRGLIEFDFMKMYRVCEEIEREFNDKAKRN